MVLYPLGMHHRKWCDRSYSVSLCGTPDPYPLKTGAAPTPYSLVGPGAVRVRYRPRCKTEKRTWFRLELQVETLVVFIP